MSIRYFIYYYSFCVLLLLILCEHHIENQRLSPADQSPPDKEPSGELCSQTPISFSMRSTPIMRVYWWWLITLPLIHRPFRIKTECEYGNDTKCGSLHFWHLRTELTRCFVTVWTSKINKNNTKHNPIVKITNWNY